MSDKLNELIKRYGDLHRRIRELDAEATELRKEKERLEQELRMELDEAGLDKVSVDDVTVYAKDDFYASIPRENYELAIEWLIDNGYDDLIRPSVNSQTLSAVLREMINEGVVGLDEIKKVFAVREKKRVGIRTAKNA